MTTVRVHVSRRDLVKFSLALAPRLTSNWILWAVLWAGVAGYWAYDHGLPRSGLDWTFLIVLPIVAATIGMFAALFVSLVGVLSASRESNGVLGEHVYTLKDDGFHETTRVNESLARWEGIREVRRTSAYILVQIAPGIGHVLPRRDFASETAFDEFWAELERRTGRGRLPISE
jgi:hypothetical protein